MQKLSDILKTWLPAQWDALLQQYLPAAVLTDNFWSGRPGPCPVCGGNDRFTFDNKNGRGDWVCRRCNDGSPMAGDGIQLVCRVNRISYLELEAQLLGNAAPLVPQARPATAQRVAGRMSPEAKLLRVTKQWEHAKPLQAGDHAMRYLATRVPGLRAPRPVALRLAVQAYWHERAQIGRFPTIVAQFLLPDGRMATVHRTSLDPALPVKATVVSADGEILDAKRNDVSALPLSGGAVRLMPPRDGVLGVTEGLETAYAAHMLFGVPTWYCLNRVLLSKFVVPDGFGIHTVHIFADFDAVDPKTGKSPGMADALTLAKRLRAEGFKVQVHRPKIRGTDFCDEWKTSRQLGAITPAPMTA
ncbi:primase-helicase zinc-binding domain-containing protein [Cupriavidus sp. WS]|uniref:primase-helicase zinc-binding domain-containing protein n=1 Tax=Cupriavidus sp. WS TaxID=1312922 RepID=UPI00038094D4|nr:primase-helicase zinc-binding domain-containing protein [Cupriavidus sp. WS]